MEIASQAGNDVRKPLQARSRQRFEQVLQESEKLLMERGLAAFSIPVVAARLGYTRASVYKFFPTPQSVLNELTRRHLVQLELELTKHAEALRDRPWREAIRLIAGIGTDFYNAHPVARMLILSGPATDESYKALEITIQHLAILARQIFQARGATLPQVPVDVATYAIEIATAGLRLSYYLHGEITASYRDEVARAMIAYLEHHAGDIN